MNATAAPAVPAASTPALAVRDLRTEFRVRGAWHAAVDGVSFEVGANETLALVGESGCGKSITALSVIGLVPKPQGRIGGGSVKLAGEELVGLSESELEKVRGDRIGMIFQEPMTALNPVLPIGFQVAEAIVVHRAEGRAAAEAEALRLLEEVKIPSARTRFNEYPHQFSGGMRQRVMIAMALACRPAVLLADEPTTALDVTIQAQVLGLLADLQRERGMAVLFITHNLGVVAAIADRVAVMYAGRVVESGPVAEIFSRPRHPYTEALFAAIPRMDRDAQALAAIPGRVPPIDAMPKGCRFAPRCSLREPRCEASVPPLTPTGGEGHLVACHVRAPAAGVA
ncbi:MAG: ABC transporter ATP-binding protein [Acetobacteraceae bacterium]|nr:ABC transporter ATP-binding protein [Acetobacteraceae bacterium]